MSAGEGPVLGMSLDDDAVRHVGVLAEVSDITLASHLLTDHHVPPTAITGELGSGLILLHMHLHGHVFEITEEVEGGD